MALGGKIDDIVHIIVAHDALHQFAVAHVATDEGHIGAFQLIFDGGQVAGIGQGVEDDNLDIVTIFTKDVFHKV